MDVINIIMYINIRTLSILQGLQPIFVVALLIVGFSFRQKIRIENQSDLGKITV